MSDFESLYEHLLVLRADQWVAQLPEQLAAAFSPSVHHQLLTWQEIIRELPLASAGRIDLNKGAVQIGSAEDLSPEQQQKLTEALQQFHPWRKGPFDLFGIYIDTEWRSDWKWQRLEDHISPLAKRTVLDVGCGNGYHAWRMLGAGAKLVVGVDPFLISVMQFQVVKAMHGPAPIYVLPFGIEAIPRGMKLFDTVFSMGVFYHRRSPMDHLMDLRDCLQPGGELVLETLIIDGRLGEVLVPEARYAKMRNVWFIPSVSTLLSWLTRCGFKNARVVDISITTVDEQRTTAWMRFNSLKSFLNPEDMRLTCEGLPAPKRGVFLANT